MRGRIGDLTGLQKKLLFLHVLPFMFSRFAATYLLMRRLLATSAIFFVLWRRLTGILVIFAVQPGPGVSPFSLGRSR